MTRKIGAVILSAPLLLGGTACKRDADGEGPAERAGKQIDRGVERAGEQLGKALERGGEAAKKAGEELQKEASK